MASGSSYPGTLDSWVDKLAGDYLTIPDVNSRTSAIEKLETGPLRPNDGSSTTPAYAFRSAANSGIFYSPGAPTLGFSIGGFLSAAILKASAPVNYIVLLASNTLTGPGIIATGTDTNIDLLLQAKGTGQILLGGGTNTDLKWGRALVNMGGGSVATMGSIGGSGPTVATQNTWMRVVDSSNAAFWVPVWK